MIIKKTTYKDQVAEYVYNLVLEGTYAPGDQVKESKLAAKLGISRAPVREAMRGLVASGILEYRPQVGYYINSLSPKQIIDAYTTRGVLEGFAVRSTIHLFGEEQVEELSELPLKMQKAAERENRKKVVEIGDTFHSLLISENRNVQLAEYSGMLSLKLHVLFFKHWPSLYSPEEIRIRHDNIVSAIAKGDPILVEDVIRGHYTETGTKIAKLNS